MIRRKNASKTPSAVNSAESEALTFGRGIARNAGPDDLASVVDACNFRLRDDGSLVLREPDVSLSPLCSAVFAMRDGRHVMKIGSRVPHVRDALYPFGDSYGLWLKYIPYGSSRYSYRPYRRVRIPPDADTYYMKEIDSLDDIPSAAVDRSHVYVRRGARPIRAGDVTLIPAYIDTARLTDAVDPDLYGAGAVLPRYLSVYYDEPVGKWVAEVVSPEVNTVVDDGSAETFRPNMLLDNPYALRDLYGYGSVGVHGVVAYQDMGASLAPSPSSSYGKESQGSFSITLMNAMFGVDVKAGEVNVYLNAHASLAPLSMCMGPNGCANSADELYRMDGEIACGVSQVRVLYDGDEQATSVIGDGVRRCSSYIPAYTPLASFTLPRVAAGVLTLRVYMYRDGANATVYVYPGDASVDTLHTQSPLELSVAQFSYFEISIALDSNGNPVDRDHGFKFGMDGRGVFIEPDPSQASADLYSLSLSQFESDDAAASAALPYSSDDRMYLDATRQSWTLYYYTWSLPSNSSYYDGLDGVKVKELTECVDDPQFDMVSRLSADDERPIVLKALMSFSKSMGCFYGVWETSDDGGVTWAACPEFLRKNADSLISIPTADQTYSQESLTSAGDYVRYIKAAPISAEDGDDLATDRVDVLTITQTPRTNMFRFSVYRYEKAASEGAAVPMAVANPTVDVPQGSHLECPRRGSTYVIGTRMHLLQSQRQGISLFIPDCAFTTGRAFVVKYAVTEDVSRLLTDSDCSSGTVVMHEERSVSGTGYTYFLPEDAFASNPAITHELRLRFAVFADGAAVPGMSIDALYMYSSASVLRNAHSGDAAASSQRLRFTSAPEPAIRVISESGKLVHNGTDYAFEDYPMNGSGTFGSAGGSAIKAVYSVTATVSNPSSVHMLVAFCCNSPSQSHTGNIFSVSSGEIASSSARLSIDGVAASGAFEANGATKAVCRAFDRGNSVRYRVLAPGQSVSVEFEYELATRAFSKSEAGSTSVKYMIQALAYPLVVVTPHGDLTVTANSRYTAFTKTPEYSSDVYFHAVNDFAYYQGEEYPYPVYDPSVLGTLLDGSWFANGTLTKAESAATSTALRTPYVMKAVLASLRPYLPDLVEGPTEYMGWGSGSRSFPTLTEGRSIYHEHRLLTYGVNGFESTLYVSDPDSYVTPLQSALEFSYGSAVTAVMPWRDYVMVFTENATYMLIKDASSPSGYAVRTVNSQIGVPKSDGDSVQAILNGILFKAGDKAYVYVPGRYSTVDTMLNIKRISDPIEHLLDEGARTLSFVQDDEWHLFQSAFDETGRSFGSELIYNYAKNAWTRSTHAFFPDDAFEYGASWRMLIGSNTYIVSYGRCIEDMRIRDEGGDAIDMSPLKDIRYGDVVPGGPGSNAGFLGDLYNHRDDIGGALSVLDARVSGFGYAIDTGQRSGRFTVDKQFLESKFSVMSLDDREAFPLTLSVYANGMPHAYRMDANTDSPFWKTSKTLDTGAAATTFESSDANWAGIMRQMFVKYSGRGKTLRITIDGVSESRFAVYSVESRYRVLPNKQ